ncbi:hypothetical protein LCM20_17985 [Halobacillus litoralis]|uniref:hypothetical protein n=1 Tax=Halobacillus litoralis TaxID=45668 RepID=UPI001CD60889|nr:hypothetical protein [Halobacillus litoralis]MCA0972490.1 hypothetical protein [Halobacillus litoralis]
MLFFNKKKKQTQQVEQLYQEIINLQKQILEAQKKPVEYHLHFDHVEVNHPKLDELNFKLDELDIEELSGALNLGNNFGVSVQPAKKPQVKNTKNGMTFTFKEE